MTKQEERILNLIRSNPTIEQEAIGEVLGIKRSTVAVHISSLIKQGYIAGKGYILNDRNYVVGIGAANIDIYGKSSIKIRTHYDHPAGIKTSVGGVTRNILVNLSKLNIDTKFITAVGDDYFGKQIIDDCKYYGIDTSNIITVKDKSSGVFMQVQDDNNDMYLALCDMSALESITPEYINSNKRTILNAKLVLIDSSLRMDTIEEIINICKDKVPIYIDPISDNYALKIKTIIHKFDCVKPNKTELENMCGVKINTIEDVYKGCQKLIDKGLKKIFVSVGKDGILYMNGNGSKIIKKFKPITKMINASGAGDAAMAAIIYGCINNLRIEETIDYGLAAGSLAIMSEKTINEKMSINELNKIIKENN